MTHLEHKKKAPSSVKFGIITISDSRYGQFKEGREVDDESSLLAKRIIEENGFEVSAKEIVPDDSSKIIRSVLSFVERNDCDAVLTIGGTGLSKRDVTIESVRKIMDKEVTGFGEIFRSLSFQSIGTPAILSRAIAGVIGNKTIFSLPGSPQSVELGLKGLILPEVTHMLKHIRE